MEFEQLDKKRVALDGLRPLSEALERNLDEWFTVELTWTSNAIEGNTLTRRETALVVEQGLTVGGKSLVEHLEAMNHAKAVEWMRAQVERAPTDLDERDLLTLHGLVLQGIDDAHAGRYRNMAVRLSGSAVVLPNAAKVPALMEDFAAWLATPNNLHPVERASEAHYRLVSIHPFVDGNGRTARLLMNVLLLMHGYPPAIIQKRERLRYIASLEKAQLGGSKEDYLKLMAKAAERSLDIYLSAARGTPEPAPEEESLLKIGQLAGRAGVATSTIRHWTKEGLVEVAAFTESGYHLYTPDTADRVKEIQRLKNERLTLAEIRERLDR